MRRQRSTLQAIAAQARATEDELSGAAAWSHSAQHAISDGILTREEETNFRAFRDRMAALNVPSVVPRSANRNRASAERVPAEAGRAALANGDGVMSLKGAHNP